MSEPLELINDALVEIFEGAGLRVLDSFPDAIPEPPLLYLELGSVSSDKAGQVGTRVYTFNGKLLLRFQEWEASEAEARGWVDPILDALEADPTLGGYLGPLGGRAVIEMGEPDYDQVGDIDYRMLPFTIRVTRKRAA